MHVLVDFDTFYDSWKNNKTLFVLSLFSKFCKLTICAQPCEEARSTVSSQTPDIFFSEGKLSLISHFVYMAHYRHRLCWRSYPGPIAQRSVMSQFSVEQSTDMFTALMVTVSVVSISQTRCIYCRLNNCHLLYVFAEFDLNHWLRSLPLRLLCNQTKYQGPG